MAVSDFYTARWLDLICISAHCKYDDDDDDDDDDDNKCLNKQVSCHNVQQRAPDGRCNNNNNNNNNNVQQDICYQPEPLTN